jgi:hypothetical protein
MSDQKVKDMGNLSRASDEVRKKLELSFAPQPALKPINQNTEVNTSVNTEINKSVSQDINKTINPEVHRSVDMENGKTINTEFNKSVNTEIPISGKAEFKPTSINTESHINQTTAAAKIGSRYKKIAPRAKDSLKSKATFCLDMVAVDQLNMVYIKRLSSHQKSDRSSLICEAISLLFEKEKPV